MDVANENLLDNGFLNIEGGVPPFYSIEGGVPVFYNAGGEEETENEDYTEYEGEEAETDVPQEDLPKFRVLVRNKKLELKAQYGKAHFGTRRECKNVPFPTTCYKQVCAFGKCANVPYPCMKNREVCGNIPVWVWGWRKKWREFKRDGGLAQLKMQSKGLAPIPTPDLTPTPTYTPTPTPTPTPTKDSDDSTEGSSEREKDELDKPKKTKKTKSSSNTGLYVGIGLVALVGGIFLIKKYTK